ncbi:MAG: methyltransferase domain-containing protein [Candidatus Nanoarchaeia archaeon]|nr:methyltransferase domain-containing protein [Candidatus Nanoarchaeia archaeon]
MDVLDWFKENGIGLDEFVKNYPPNKLINFSEKEGNLASRVRPIKSFDGLNVLNISRARDIEQIITLLIMNGSINPDNLSGNVVDFGMGTGPGSYVLKQYGGNITGVDSQEVGVKIAIEEGILPKEKALVQDGFEYLRSLQSQSLDFLAAFMMNEYFPSERLYQESQRVLKSGGQLLITGGLNELKDKLQNDVSKYGKVEEIITSQHDRIFGNVAFTYTK